MLFWKPDGAVRSHELYHVNPGAWEEGRDIAKKEANKANNLRGILLGHLKSVDAEKALKVPAKRK